MLHLPSAFIKFNVDYDDVEFTLAVATHVTYYIREIIEAHFNVSPQIVYMIKEAIYTWVDHVIEHKVCYSYSWSRCIKEFSKTFECKEFKLTVIIQVLKSTQQ